MAAVTAGSILTLGMVGWATDWGTSRDLAGFGGTVSAGGLGVFLSEVANLPEKFNIGFDDTPAPATAPGP